MDLTKKKSQSKSFDALVFAAVVVVLRKGILQSWLELGREKKTFLEIGLQLHPACGKMSTFKKIPNKVYIVNSV